MRATRSRYSVEELRELADSHAVPVVIRQAIADALFHIGQAHERVAAIINARQADALEIRELRQSRDDAHHVLVRHGVVPGADGTCRCNQCRAVAKAYAEAGYAFTIKDRWWETDDVAGARCEHGQLLSDPCEGCTEELARKMNEDALRTAGLALSPESLARQNSIDQQATAAYMLRQGKAQADRQFP